MQDLNRVILQSSNWNFSDSENSTAHSPRIFHGSAVFTCKHDSPIKREIFGKKEIRIYLPSKDQSSANACNLYSVLVTRKFRDEQVFNLPAPGNFDKRSTRKLNNSARNEVALSLLRGCYTSRRYYPSSELLRQKEQLNIVGYYAVIFQFSSTNVFRGAYTSRATIVPCICQDSDRSFVLLFSTPPRRRHVGK